MPHPSWHPGDRIAAPEGPLVTIDPASTPFAEMYKLIIGAIVPRPIAFVSTVDLHGAGNLAPFSFFNGVCSNPPALMISVARKPDGSKKDTLRNIEETGEFVVNSANEWLIEPLVYCGAAFPHGVNEMQKVGLTPLASLAVKPPRVRESAVQFECTVLQIVQVGDGSPGSASVVIGRIVQAHVLEQALDKGRLDYGVLRNAARLGGAAYGIIGETFELPIPDVDEHENFVVRPRKS